MELKTAEHTPDEHLELTKDRIIELNVLNPPEESNIILFTREEIEDDFGFLEN